MTPQKPTAAIGPFPYRHRTCAEWIAYQQIGLAIAHTAQRSGFAPVAPRNVGLEPRYTPLVKELKADCLSASQRRLLNALDVPGWWALGEIGLGSGNRLKHDARYLRDIGLLESKFNARGSALIWRKI